MESVVVRSLGRQDYAPTLARMQGFTDRRTPETPDEIWCLEHPPVFTLGQAGRSEHLLSPGGIPIVRCDRGGQVTYHGPGQLVCYLLVDLRRRGLGIRAFVSLIEQAIVDLLADHGIDSAPRADAPGVYCDGRKIASLGLRVRRGCSYHGLSLNVAMDLEPFRRIDPCGQAGLEVTQLADLGGPADPVEVIDALTDHLVRLLGYTTRTTTRSLGLDVPSMTDSETVARPPDDGHNE